MTQTQQDFLTVVEALGGACQTCGYCKADGNLPTSTSYGMWAHQMSVEAYEKLLNRCRWHQHAHRDPQQDVAWPGLITYAQLVPVPAGAGGGVGNTCIVQYWTRAAAHPTRSELMCTSSRLTRWEKAHTACAASYASSLLPPAVRTGLALDHTPK